MNSMAKKILQLVLLLIFLGCKNVSDNAAKDHPTSNQEELLYRPNFHFTPQKNWMNDPNGMFYHEGLYHLFFQHYPDKNVWGPMHWGHAVSDDLIKWTEKPIALYPDEKGYIFSGSAVVDSANTSGFGENGRIPIVAMFTYHDPKGEKEQTLYYQTQGLAYSLDNGNTWTKYSQNPVIANPGLRDFRDPKMFWSTEYKKWLMVLSAYDKTLFFESNNLKEWKFLSEFGKGVGAHGGIWECPDFFPMTVKGIGEKKWVLLQSLNEGAPNGGSGTQYFVGDFDGKTFKLDSIFSNSLTKEEALWIDYGRDNYAGVTWSNIPSSDGRKLFIGWMSNWDYAKVVPTQGWRSTMTIPRELALVKNENGYQILSKPIRELAAQTKLRHSYDRIKIEKNQHWSLDVNTLARAKIDFTIDKRENKLLRFILSNNEGDTLSFGYDDFKKAFFVDRKKLINHNFSKKYADKITTATRKSDKNTLSGTIILDKTSIESFYDAGETVLTEIFFPMKPFERLTITSEEHDLVLSSLDVYEIVLK